MKVSGVMHTVKSFDFLNNRLKVDWLISFADLSAPLVDYWNN